MCSTTRRYVQHSFPNFFSQNCFVYIQPAWINIDENIWPQDAILFISVDWVMHIQQNGSFKKD